MKRRRWQRKSGVTASIVLGVFLLALAVVFLIWAPRLGHGKAQGKTIGFAQIVSTTAGVIGVGNGMVQLLAWWRRSSGPSAAPTTSEIDVAKDILAGLVNEQWTEETVVRSLGDPEPIPVPWRSTEHEELMDHPRLIAKGTLSFPSLGDHITTMVNDFRALRCRRLVILGGPGTGKTTLAVQLLIELLRTRLPEEPVPVLLSAARWDTKVHPRLRNWLAECLDMDYPALRAGEGRPDTPRTLAIRGEVLPILDGLDELPGDARADILAALNRSMGDDDQLILTCRTAQFAESVEAIGDVLTAAAVIEPHPLTPGVAANYLQACLPSRLPHTWPDVLNALREGAAAALAEVTSTPLGLWLVRITYVAPRQDPQPLLDLGRGDPSLLRDHLYDQLIPALISSRPPTDDPAQPFRPHHSWKPDQVHRWLTYLARQLTVTGEDTSDVAWWHLARYTHTRLVRVAVSLVYGLVVGLAIGVLTRPLAGAVMGLLSGLVVMLTTGSWFTQSPGYADFRLRGRGALLLQTLIEGLIIGLLGVLVGWIMSRGLFSAAIEMGLLSGLGFVFVLGMTRWSECPTMTTTARSPRATWQADRNLTLIRILIGMVVGLMAGIIGLQAQLSPTTALVGGLLLGLLFGLIVGGHHAWLAYSLTVPRLASKGALPLRTMEFLEDAHRLGLLRTEGPFYQFRNIELQKHLSG
jgi:hypothetical protein